MLKKKKIEAEKGAKMLRLLNENDKNEIMESISKLDSQVAGGQIIIEKSGEVIAISDSAEASLVGLSVFGKSTQDGTPTPTAPIEILSVENPTVAVCGVNLWDEETEYGYWQSANGEAYSADNQIRSKNIISIIPNSTIYVTAPNDKIIDFVFYDRNKSYLSSQSIAKEVTSPDNAYYMHINLRSDYGTTYKNDVCISLNPLNGAYKATAGNQALVTSYTLRGIPVDSDSYYNYTDKNGQHWVCDEVDFERGVLVERTKEIVFDGVDGETITLYAERQNVYGFTLRITDNSMLKLAHEAMSTRFENIKTGISSVDRECFLCGAGSSSIYVMIGKSRLSGYSIDAFKNWLSANPLTILYQLATPIETALTEEELESYKTLHTNKPNTTIFNDIGTGMAVEYVADHKLYVDNKFAELQALITS